MKGNDPANFAAAGTRLQIRAGALPMKDNLLACPSPLHLPTMKVSDVRQLIVNTLQDLGFGDPEPLGERLLTRDRFYVGCRFEFAGASAIWLEEAGQVRFIDASGKLLKIVRIPTEAGNAAIVDRAA